MFLQGLTSMLYFGQQLYVKLRLVNIYFLWYLAVANKILEVAGFIANRLVSLVIPKEGFLFVPLLLDYASDVILFVGVIPSVWQIVFIFVLLVYSLRTAYGSATT